MAFKIGSHPPFHLSQKMKKNVPLSPAKADKKALTFVNQASKKNSTTWYVEGIDLSPTQENSCLPGTKKLSPDRVHLISVTPQASSKNKPTPLPRSNTTHLNSAPRHSKIDKTEEIYKPGSLSVISTKNKIPPEPLPRSNDKQKKAFGVDLSDVTNAKNALKPTDKKIPSELSQASEPSTIEKKPSKIESVPVTVSTPLSKKRISFKPEISALKTPNAPLKGILKKIPPFNETIDTKAVTKDAEISTSETLPSNNTDIESKKTVLKEELAEWADVDKIFSECFEYLNNHNSS